jgi:hypothetical protein
VHFPLQYVARRIISLVTIEVVKLPVMAARIIAGKYIMRFLCFCVNLEVNLCDTRDLIETQLGWRAAADGAGERSTSLISGYNSTTSVDETIPGNSLGCYSS